MKKATTLGIIPALSDYWVVTVIWESGGINPEIVKIPIVAWRILEFDPDNEDKWGNEWAKPITCDEIDEPAAILYPDGRVIEPLICEYPNTDSWLKAKIEENKQKKG